MRLAPDDAVRPYRSLPRDLLRSHDLASGKLRVSRIGYLSAMASYVMRAISGLLSTTCPTNSESASARNDRMETPKCRASSQEADACNSSLATFSSQI